MPDRQLYGVIQYLRQIAARGDSAHISDDQLLERFVTQRDEAAFELLVWRHGKMVLGVCRRLLRDIHAAEDAFQASFLVLARRAPSIRKHASVGGWLYKVAYRVAVQARAQTIKRTSREIPLPDGFGTETQTDPFFEAEQRELRAVIDEEVNRLPEKYQVPFVLCYIEGKSNQEAAREIGCPLGTVESRLSRARQRLRTRLSRRGFVSAMGLTTAMLSESVASTSVPTTLVMRTGTVAVRVAAGQVAGAVPAPVAALTEWELKAMFRTKLRIIAVLLTVGLLGTVGLSSHLVRGEKSLENDPDNPALPTAEKKIAFEKDDPAPPELEKKITLALRDKPWVGERDSVLEWLSDQAGMPVCSSPLPTGAPTFLAKVELAPSSLKPTGTLTFISPRGVPPPC
jgi:RNA polymerase sigma factor (sigma-70 family)